MVVDDEPDACEMLAMALSGQGYDVETRQTAESALARLAEVEFDAVLVDVRLGPDSGLDLCRAIAGAHSGLPVILVTGYGSMDLAIGAIRSGAYDFITKPVSTEHVAHCVRRAVRHRELERTVQRLEQAVRRGAAIPGLIGDSPAIRKVVDLVARVGPTDSTVLITGESGVGKELVARALHDHSEATGEFVAINCAAMPDTLLEAELFGHVKGAFTDAKGRREGLLRRAHGGTIFLDEIGEMPPTTQPKLLRALQERVFRPIGSDDEVVFDARIVCATNRDIEDLVERGLFRQDLYYRVAVVEIQVPPLRARETDTLLLAQAFLKDEAQRAGKDIGGFDVPVAEKLLSYPWPGNVRELHNCIQRAVALARFEEIKLEDLPDNVRQHEADELLVAGTDPEALPSLEELEARYIRRVLRAVGGNKTRAASILGLGRRTLYRKIEKLDIDVPGA